MLNITRDSFSDGGRYFDTDAAIAHGRKLKKDGAHILDLGAAASNPGAEPVSPEEELARLTPAVKAFKEDGIPLSIDTFSCDVQRWCLRQGVAYLNDIHGFPDPALYPALAESDAKLIVMHAVQAEGRATVVDVPPEAIYQRVVDFFEARLAALTRAGVDRSRLILDPGMGMFLSRQPQASFEMLRRVPDLKKAFGLPVLIAVSRKSFLRLTVDRGTSGAGPATLAAEIFAVFRGADYIRTHEPAALADGLAVWAAALTGNRTSNS